MTKIIPTWCATIAQVSKFMNTKSINWIWWKSIDHPKNFRLIIVIFNYCKKTCYKIWLNTIMRYPGLTLFTATFVYWKTHIALEYTVIDKNGLDYKEDWRTFKSSSGNVKNWIWIKIGEFIAFCDTQGCLSATTLRAAICHNLAIFVQIQCLTLPELEMMGL